MPQLKCFDIFLPSGLLTLNSVYNFPCRISITHQLRIFLSLNLLHWKYFFHKHTPVSIEPKLFNYLNADVAILKQNLLNLLSVAMKWKTCRVQGMRTTSSFQVQVSVQPGEARPVHCAGWPGGQQELGCQPAGWMSSFHAAVPWFGHYPEISFRSLAQGQPTIPCLQVFYHFGNLVGSSCLLRNTGA